LLQINQLRRGSADALPFADATSDKAFAINSMQVWPDAIAGSRSRESARTSSIL
jgi:hypothetical protein